MRDGSKQKLFFRRWHCEPGKNHKFPQQGDRHNQNSFLRLRRLELALKDHIRNLLPIFQLAHSSLQHIEDLIANL